MAEVRQFIFCPKCGEKNAPDKQVCWVCMTILTNRTVVMDYGPKKKPPFTLPRLVKILGYLFLATFVLGILIAFGLFLLIWITCSGKNW